MAQATISPRLLLTSRPTTWTQMIPVSNSHFGAVSSMAILSTWETYNAGCIGGDKKDDYCGASSDTKRAENVTLEAVAWEA
jgi:hypothetical protein